LFGERSLHGLHCNDRFGCYCEYVLKYLRENSVLNENINWPRCINRIVLKFKQVKLPKNKIWFCISIIIGLVHYPNHTFLKNYNSLIRAGLNCKHDLKREIEFRYQKLKTAQVLLTKTCTLAHLLSPLSCETRSLFS